MTERSQQDLQSLVARGGVQARLQPLPRQEPLPAGVGTGDRQASSARASTAGIASPLREVSPPQRTYHPPRQVLSSDGLFSFEWQPLASIAMVDANDREVVLEFGDPDAV